LAQNALDSVDTYCSPQKQFRMLKIILDFHSLAERVVNKGTPIFKTIQLPITEEIMRMKTSVPNEKINLLDDLERRMQQHFSELEISLR
jgi:V/A-type H+-transporting ATPase subunit A